MFLLKAHIAIHKFDIICISDTYLDCSTPSDHSNLGISGYGLVCSDHPSNNKRGGVCILLPKPFTFFTFKNFYLPIFARKYMF